MKTLLLHPVKWDLVLDANGNIAVATDPYRTAQDVACALRTFLGELWYQKTRGVPYFQNILGQSPSLGFVKAKLEAAALEVPGVTSATAYISSFTNRKLSGQIQVTDSTGKIITVTIPTLGNFTLDRSSLS